ncbi:hypothetical protein [Guptibacillus hwajinpoensis]
MNTDNLVERLKLLGWSYTADQLDGLLEGITGTVLVIHFPM